SWPPWPPSPGFCPGFCCEPSPPPRLSSSPSRPIGLFPFKKALTEHQLVEEPHRSLAVGRRVAERPVGGPLVLPAASRSARRPVHPGAAGLLAEGRPVASLPSCRSGRRVDLETHRSAPQRRGCNVPGARTSSTFLG